MLQAAICALLLLGIYKMMTSKSDYKIDWWMAFSFVLLPMFLMFLLTVGLDAMGLPPQFAAAGYLLYFLIPFAFLKTSMEFSASEAGKYAAIVPMVVIVVEVPLVLMMGSGG